MNDQIHIDSEELFLEITRYLAAVDLYRALRCEPTWRPESARALTYDEPLQLQAEQAPPARL